MQQEDGYIISSKDKDKFEGSAYGKYNTRVIAQGSSKQEVDSEMESKEGTQKIPNVSSFLN